jgi:hypothetical protein
LVQALPLRGGGQRGGLMRFRINPQRELSGKMAARIDALLGAGIPLISGHGFYGVSK